LRGFVESFLRTNVSGPLQTGIQWARLENKEIEDYIGFFEEIGIYASRDLVDVELVDTILGDAIVECYEDRDIIDFVRSVRVEEGDNTYWEFFEKLAADLVARRNQRRIRNKP